MKFKYSLLTLVAFCFFSQATYAQMNEKYEEQDITVFESVLNTAAWANFKYEEQLLAAKRGDHKATLKLLEFSGTVDGVAELDHSVTLLELLASGGDVTFGAAVNMTKPKLKSVLLQRLQLAQGRTKNEILREPLAKWAPLTWDVLNGKPFTPAAPPADERAKKDKDKAKEVRANSTHISPVTDDLTPAVSIPKSSDEPSKTKSKSKGKQ